ncbi:MAG: hypothetical protein ACRES9_04270, partial [Gammaproteobacteria bacterium]
MDTESLYSAALGDLERGFTVRGETRLHQAATAGYGRAQLALAQRLAKRAGPVAAHDPNVLDWLEKSIANGIDEALFFRSALHYGVGRKEAAREDLNRAAAADCPPAQTALALAWLEHAGEEARQNGWAWLVCAAENGDRAAEALMRCERQQVHRVEMLPPVLPAWAASTAADDWENLCATPSVKYAEAVLSPLECAWLRTSARPELKPSRILDPVTRRPR